MTPKTTGRAASLARRSAVKARNKSPKKQVAGASAFGGSARGDDFAESFSSAPETETVRKEKVDTKPRTKKELKRASFGLAGGSSPTVMSNANKIERVVPLLNSRTSNLSSFNLSGDQGGGGANFSDTSEGGGGGFEDTGDEFDQLLGFEDKKKKKKEEIVYSPMEQQQLNLLQQMQKTQDRRLRKSITDAQRTFDQRRREQEDVTQSGLNNLRQVLNLAGSSRYAPISSQGIISAGEQAGIKALADLDALEQKTVAEIQEARDQLDYQTLEKKFDFLDKLRVEKQTAADTLDEEIKTRQERITKDNALGGLIAQGITDPIELLDMLNYNEAGELVGDFSLAEITDGLNAIKDLRPKGNGIGFEMDNKMVGQLLGAGLATTDIQNMQADLDSGASLDDIMAGFDTDTQTMVKEAFGIKPGTQTPIVTPGKGAKTPLEENLVRTRLFSKIAPILNKGALSDSDRAIIDARISEFRDAGMGEQEILDAIAGLPPEIASPYNSSFRDLIVSNSETTEKQSQAIGKLSQQLQKGNYLPAMNEVENMALAKAKLLDPDNYVGTGTAQKALKKVEELEKLLAQTDSDEVIGPVEGFKEKIKGKFRDPKAQEIRSKIAVLVAQMRNELSGTAVTASEASFLEPLIPDITDTRENFELKLKALNDDTLNRYNGVRSIVSLPTVTKEQVIDPKKRLILYSNEIYLPTDGAIDL